MAAAAIHVVPDDNFDDLVVRDHDGHEFGHYPTREVAEPAAEAIARAEPPDQRGADRCSDPTIDGDQRSDRWQRLQRPMQTPAKETSMRLGTICIALAILA